MPRRKTKVLRSGEHSEKQLLLGFSSAEITVIERAARLCKERRGPFIRQAAVYWAEKICADDARKKAAKS
jgi:uncharacterized protein (DUF1778 family)